MNSELEKAQDMFLEKINKFCREYGLNNVMAQLYAILYLSKEPLSLNDMTEQLRISKGSVSINIRALEGYGVVRRVWVKGSRKDYYEAEIDITKVVLDRIKSMASKRLSEIGNMLESIYQVLNSISSGDKEERELLVTFRGRIDKLKSFHTQAQSLFNLFNSGIVNGLMNNKRAKAKKKEIASTEAAEIIV